MIAVLNGDELAAAGVGHRELQRAFDRFGAAGRTVGNCELAGCDAGEHFGELDPGAVEVVRMNVIRTIELRRRRANFCIPPAQVADAPARHEVDVFAAARVGEIAVSGATDDNIQVHSGDRSAFYRAGEGSCRTPREAIHSNGQAEPNGVPYRLPP